MSRTVKFEIEVEVEDDKATHVAVDDNGCTCSFRDKPKMLHDTAEWSAILCKRCKVKNWESLCIELPEPETDWSKVKPLTRVFCKGDICEFLSYSEELDKIRLLINHKELCTDTKNVELVKENGGDE